MLKSMNISTEDSFNSTKWLYLVFTIVGSIAPWFWLLQDPTALLSPTLFLQATFANNIATAWASDLIVSAIAFLCLVGMELKRLNVSQRWIILYIGLTLGVGLSCSLPFFLFAESRFSNEGWETPKTFIAKG
jgi:hypothetical protein